MIKNIFLTCIALVLTFSCSGSDPDPGTNQDNTTIDDETNNPPEEICHIVNKDGLLIIEAESFELKGKWRIVEDSKTTGGKYIEYYGSNSYNTQNLNNEISVKFKVDAAATYLVRWYMRQPEEAEGDKSNDVWIYFPGDIGLAKHNGEDITLEHYEKFVSRGKGEFTYGGALDMHNPKYSSWMRVRFPSEGEYELKICARSEFFQLDKLVLSTGMPDEEAETKSKTLSETIECE